MDSCLFNFLQFHSASCNSPQCPPVTCNFFSFLQLLPYCLWLPSPPATSSSFLQLPSPPATSSNSQLPPASYNFLPLCNFIHLPGTSPGFLQFFSAYCNFLQLPATFFSLLRFPQLPATSSSSQLPLASYIFFSNFLHTLQLLPASYNFFQLTANSFSFLLELPACLCNFLYFPAASFLQGAADCCRFPQLPVAPCRFLQPVLRCLIRPGLPLIRHQLQSSL